MKRRDLIRMLETAGYNKIRDTGDHTIYKMAGCVILQVPRHREVNENTAKAILKDAGLK